MKAVCVSIALLLCLMRFSFAAHPLSVIGTYQAFAHLFVGILIGMWYVGRRFMFTDEFCDYTWAGVLAIVISLVELIAAIMGRI